MNLNLKLKYYKVSRKVNSIPLKEKGERKDTKRNNELRSDSLIGRIENIWTPSFLDIVILNIDFRMLLT